MESTELARWQRFAAKGGIGRSTAIVDCVAERDGDLMFLKDDEVTVLMQLPETGYYLGYCEGVVGRFVITDVQVHGKLKRAVMARRSASGTSSPSSPTTLSVSPTPSIPHTTYSPPMRQPVDQLMTHARAENSLTGVSTLLASPPASQSVLPDDQPEAKLEPKPVSRSSSPLRLDTATIVVSQRESLDSLASTEASPLSDSSVYSFRRKSNDEGVGDTVTTHQEAAQPMEDRGRNAGHDVETLSPRSPNTSNSRASSPSIDNPFHHDDLAGASSPSTPGHEDVIPPVEHEEPLYADSRDSIYSDSNVDMTGRAESTRVVSAAMSDGEVGIGLTLIGGLLGAGRESMISTADSQDDYPEAEGSNYRGAGYATGSGSEQLEYGDDDTSLYRNDSLEEDGQGIDEAGDVTISGQEERDTSLEHRNATPTPGWAGRLSHNSTESRSSTPPFGFELEPTLHHGTGIETSEDVRHEVDQRAVEADEVLAANSKSIPGDQSETDETAPSEEPNSEQPKPASPQPNSSTFISRQNSVALDQQAGDDEPILPPVRPPYHRASSSMHSVASSNAGGYYDDGIYDHYRASYVSMAAKSMRFSIIGAGGEMPPLPGESEWAEGGARFAPLNLQGTRTVRSGPSSGSQGSPRSLGPTSPLARMQGEQEPMSPGSSGSGMSPLAAGPILQAQMANEPEETTREYGTSSNSPSSPSGLAPITTTGPSASGLGALAIPASPISSVPPSPALSGNLASSLRQAIEQQQVENPESSSQPDEGSNRDDQSIDEDKPILASPIMIQETPGLSPIASLQRRPSQFAPHPNAPKPANHFSAAAPISGPSDTPDSNHTQHAGAAQMKLNDALHLVLQRLRTGGARTPTIHGRTHSELGLSSGPVPISFLFDPDGRSVPVVGRGTVIPGRLMVGAQRSASMNEGAPRGEVGSPEYTRSKLRPRSRSFSGAPQEEVNALRSAAEPRSSTQLEARTPVSTTPAMSSPLAQLSKPGSPYLPTTPVQTSEFPVQPSSGNNSPIQRIASPPTNGPSSGSKSPFRSLRNVASNTMLRVGLGSISIPASPTPKDQQSEPSPQQGRSSDVPRHNGSVDSHAPSSTVPSNSPIAPSNMSLHSKGSSSALRITRASPHPAAAETPTTPLSPVSPVQHADETINVHDMDFDLIKPKAIQTPTARLSEDGGYSGSRQSHQTDRSPTLPQGESPTSPTSPLATSPSHQTRGSIPASVVPPSSGHSSLTNPTSIAAHISREQRWISAMQTIPSSSVRKNKKIKKLLLEGVPASVRGVVWLYLTDSKARRMDGVYLQLCKRGHVPATPDILKDLSLYFNSQPHLQAQDGPVVSILQAYLTMVPDITYNQSLCQIAGNLLMHSPEEDAFWTFVALMDNYLRGYYATNSLQLEADSVFFAKTLESNDSQLATKLFRELGLGAMDFCKPWILSGFVSTVPYEYSCRIWDIFLFEGTPFLFRIALALLGRLKPQIMALTSKSSPGTLAYLLSVSPQCLPSDPDQLIASAYSVKFKDDDMRKTRPKTEAQLRKESGHNRSVAVRDALKK